MVLRTFIFLIIFSIGLIAQPFSPLPQLSTLSAEDVDLGTFTQTAAPDTNNLAVTIGSGYMPLLVDSATADGVTLLTDTEILPDSILYAQTVNDLIVSSGDSISTNADSTYKAWFNTGSNGSISYGLNGLEENQMYEVTFGRKEGETDIITNGTFDTDTDWIKAGSGATISGGKATLNSASDTYIYQNILDADSYYGLVFDLTLRGGSLKYGENVNYGGTISTICSDSTFVLYFSTDSSPSFFIFRSSNVDCDIDNVRVYKLDSESQKVETATPSITFNGNTTTFNALSSTWQDSSFGVLALGSNSDTLTITVDDTCKFDFSLSVKKKHDNFVVNANDTMYLPYIVDLSTVGDYSETISLYNTGSVNPVTANITYSVIASNNLYVNNSDSLINTLDFGTVSNITTELLLTLENKTNTAKTINWYKGTDGLSFWGGTWVINRPSTYPIILTLPANTKDSMYIRFNPLADASYQDTLLISSGFSSSVDTIVMKGTASGLSGSTFLATTLSVSNNTDYIALDWEDVENATGYRIYRKASDEASYEKIDDITAPPYTDESIVQLLNYNYFYVAYNNNETANSDTVTTQSSPSGTVYYVSETGTGDTLNNITEVNASVAGGIDKWVLFKSGDQFTDGTLLCKQSVKYGTYGGSTKAILGDSTANTNSVTRTVYITYEDVVLSNLEIQFYDGAEEAILYTQDGLTIQDCNVFGSQSAHSELAYGIEYYNFTVPTSSNKSSIKPTLITRNNIRDFYKGVYLRLPYNVEFSYNRVHRMYGYTGRYGVGGDCLVADRASQVLEYSVDYTLNIHHNEFDGYEHTVFDIGGGISEILVEYNYVHDNLDERLFWGGMKSGSLGKLWDNSDKPTGPLGLVMRYNYIEDLERHAEIGYEYTRPTPAQIEAGSIQQTYVGGDALPLFIDGYVDGVTDWSQNSGGTFSGQGYGNFWIHNNVINRSEGSLIVRATVRINEYTYDFVDDYRAYFVNNTHIYGGTASHVTAGDGVITDENDSQSPFMVVNNIIDYVSDRARQAGRYKEYDLYLDYNIYTSQSGTSLTLPNEGDQKAAYYQRGSTQNLADATHEQYLTDPNWVDTTSTIFAPNVGISGVYIPDVRIVQGGNAYDNGMDYDLIGDEYTVLGRTHTLGQDPTGRSFAYDILGNYRSTNDIGAVGIEGAGSNDLLPSISNHPQDITASVGDTVNFDVTASVNDGSLAYQWIKGTGINGVHLTDGALYDGVHEKTFSIKNVQTSNNNETYSVIVKNKGDSTNTTLWTYSNPAVLTVNGATTSFVDTFYIAQNLGDAYMYDQLDGTPGGRNNNNTYVRLGNDGTYRNYAALLFENVTIPSGATQDSSFILLTASYDRAYNDCNIRANAEDVASPSVYGDYNDINTRRANVTTGYNDITLPAFTLDSQYKIYVTNSISELLSSYTYSSGKMSFFLQDNSSDLSAQRSFFSYDNGSKYAMLIVYYSY